jgi:hypothetical protein
VTNSGNITTAAGGSAYLIGSGVTNGGIISSPQGEVLLLAGSAVELVNPSTPQLRVEIAADSGEAINLGQILASSGSIGIYAGLIRSTGVLGADKVVGFPDGRIVLGASQSVSLEGEVNATHLSITGPTPSISPEIQGSADLTAEQIQLQGNSIQLGGQIQSQNVSWAALPQSATVSTIGGLVLIQSSSITLFSNQLLVTRGTVTAGSQTTGQGSADGPVVLQSAPNVPNLPPSASVQTASQETNSVVILSRPFVGERAATDVVNSIARALSMFSLRELSESLSPSTLTIDVGRPGR